ncbi:uncharacterized protein LOC111373662 [Olea europaea var. sylvestris]|uniref:uncharacterized protein LOC111373662 n=1 Tax=Olea europaea var. sylvestris TaxID=158386 RepID=UPI000C1CF72E|nr:uncharacterized protein LOC111373662 [Olea europaea var. sylvestris]
MRRTYRRLFDLLKGTGVEYNESTGRVVASEEWWNRKIRENKDYREFKDKDVSEIYVRYRTLFGDSYDGEKYAVTPTKLCRTGFGLFEDSALEDTRDAIPVDEESSGSSDEAEQMVGGSRFNVSDTTSGGKRKSSDATRRGKKKKSSARELSFSVDRATSATEEVVAKLNTMMGSHDDSGTACIEELLASGRLERRTPLYFFACAILAKKHYRNMLAVMKDLDEKFEWIQWLFNERGK